MRKKRQVQWKKKEGKNYGDWGILKFESYGKERGYRKELEIRKRKRKGWERE